MKRFIFSILFLSTIGWSGLAQAQSNATTINDAVELPDPPQLSSQKANEGIAEFITLFKGFATDLKEGSIDAIREFGIAAKKFQKENNDWISLLSEEDQEELQAYIMEVAQDMGLVQDGKLNIKAPNSAATSSQKVADQPKYIPVKVGH